MTAAQAGCLTAALEIGYHLLDRGAPALTVVEQAICVLEQSGLFNAGRGSHVQLDGVRRMDASIMEGQGLQAGAVASVEGIVHPISAARLVMEQTTHVMLVGKPASAFARHCGLERQLRRPSGHAARQTTMTKTWSPKTLELYRAMMAGGSTLRKRAGKETVGAVALDQAGTVAAGASTGGIDLMLPGRVGDTPIIGCGVYADNESGAVSMTGLGEGIIRIAVAKEICDRLAQGERPASAATQVLKKLVRRINGAAGSLVLAPDGRFAITHVTPRMAAGWWDGKRRPLVKDSFR
ncbi:isoaspartyl peptidase/L-asparaginase family protein [Nitrospira lenta]|uniref:Isoaspartyl peptidase n=1 Tax=Nitrospira lenta TaxID=1436998 RepID=A0A330L5P8_9BACT|nr:Isoaspartyl peptidase [Nitrospira lenta]